MCGAVSGYPPEARARDPTPKWMGLGPFADAPSRTSAHRVCERRELVEAVATSFQVLRGIISCLVDAGLAVRRGDLRVSEPVFESHFSTEGVQPPRWRHRTSASGSRTLIQSAASIPKGGHGPRPASASTPSWGSLRPGRPDQLASWFGMRDEAWIRIRSRRRRRRQDRWGVDTEWAGSVTR